MNDSDQRARYNRSAMQRNEDWYCNPPEDREYERERREDIQAQKEEWEAECAKDNALTKKDEPEWERPKYDSYWERKRELTEDEQWDLQEKMHAFQKQQRWEQDVAACQRSMRGGY
jgi:hypothetical protein